jgi:hypothetical protein
MGMKKGRRAVMTVACLLAATGCLRGAENLVITPNLDYSDHNKKQGPLITGDHMDDGVVEGMPNYIFFYMEKCYNAKRQALITVHMYEKYKNRLHFVVVDLDKPMSEAQKIAKQKYCNDIIPHETILDQHGTAVFDYTGETDEPTLEGWIKYTLQNSGAAEQAQGSNTNGSRGAAANQ